MEDILILKPQILSNKYYFVIEYIGQNEIFSKLNNELFELDGGFMVFIKNIFNKINLNFKLKKEKINEFKGMDDNFINLTFNIILTLYNYNIDMKLYYERLIISCTGPKKNKKFIEKKFNYSFTQLDVKEINQNNIKNNNYIEFLINSFIGLKNLGGTCTISSILQILIHTKCFLKEFLSLPHFPNTISYLLYKFLINIIESQDIINDFYSFCIELQNEIKVIKNDPMYFCSKLLEKIEDENTGKIIHLFSGKKKIEFQNLQDYNSEENFLFYVIHISFEGPGIKDSLFQTKKIDLMDNVNELVIQKEYLVKEPQIFMINIEKDENCQKEFYYNIPNFLTLNNSNYKLYAINKYDNVHSRV